MPKITVEKDGARVTFEGPDAAAQAREFLTPREETAQMSRDIKRLIEEMRKASQRVRHWPPTPYPHRDGLIS